MARLVVAFGKIGRAPRLAEQRLDLRLGRSARNHLGQGCIPAAPRRCQRYCLRRPPSFHRNFGGQDPIGRALCSRGGSRLEQSGFRAFPVLAPSARAGRRDPLRRCRPADEVALRTCTTWRVEWRLPREIQSAPARANIFRNVTHIARTHARAEAAIIFWGMGISQHVHGTDNAPA